MNRGHRRTEKLTKPKAIVFDTDNTLYMYKPAHKIAMREVVLKVQKTLDIKEKEFLEAFNIAKNEIKQQLKKTASSHSRLLYFQRTIEKLGMGTKIFLTLDLEQTYWRTFLVNTKLFHGIRDFLHILKLENIKTANITDLTAQIQFRKMVYFGLDEYFDYVVTSEEAGADKPDERAFNMIIKKLKLPAEDIWMVGDSLNSDIVGAKNVGMIACKMNGHDLEKRPNDGMVADVEFRSYEELMSIYQSL